MRPAYQTNLAIIVVDGKATYPPAVIDKIKVNIKEGENAVARASPEGKAMIEKREANLEEYESATNIRATLIANNPLNKYHGLSVKGIKVEVKTDKDTALAHTQSIKQEKDAQEHKTENSPHIDKPHKTTGHGDNNDHGR